MTIRQEKMRELVQQLAAEFFARESNRTTLITFTNASVSKNFKQATIYFTVFPEDQEHNVLSFLKRRRGDFRHYVKKKTAIKTIPFFDFEIDKGEKNRQHIDEISGTI